MKNTSVTKKASTENFPAPTSTKASETASSSKCGSEKVTETDTVQTAVQEKRSDEVHRIDISMLHDFPNHPFHVQNDPSFEALINSISLNGVLTPLLVRSMHNDEGYEIISGHRRKTAAMALGITELPALICKLDDNSAVIAMVDSNQQRDNLLPSEKAWAYKMKLDALKKQGRRSDLTSCQVGAKSRSDVELAKGYTDSARSIHRFICLTKLIPEILRMVDDHRIPMNTGVELSYLPNSEQTLLYNCMLKNDRIPSMSQAACLKEISQSGGLSKGDIISVMSNAKGKKISSSDLIGRLRSYFPDVSSDVDVIDQVIKLLEVKKELTVAAETEDRV